MKAYLIILILAGLVSLLQSGCGLKVNSKSSEAKIPWSRVTQVETDTDSQGKQSESGLAQRHLSPGTSQSQVIMAWGVPEYILNSPGEAGNEIWQYPHAVVVFQGTKVQQVLAR